MNSFCIGEILIGDKNRITVIPEIGINHEGSLETAKKMVLSAHHAGARWIKHQTHICEDEMSHLAKKVIPGNSDVSIYEVMERCALSEEDEAELKRYTEALGMEFISTPFSRAAAERLQRFGVKAFKIGSGECNNYPLIEHIAEFGKPMIVSTGMNDLKSVEKTVEIMEKKGVAYALMHTTNLYPTPSKLVRLGAMQELMSAFPGIPIGLSDHTLNNNACIAAMGLGAMIVERHYTDRKDRIGPDIVCSMDEDDLKELISAAEEVPLMWGGHKEAAQEEQITIDFAFATVVTTRTIKRGERFSKDNIWVKRPGTGEIPANRYEEIIGQISSQDIAEDVQLLECMIKE